MRRTETNPEYLSRYQRQIIYAPLGLDGQQALAGATVLVVGVGGLGSWAAELLARAGVGCCRLVDDDRVDLTNLHRQAMFTQSDAQAGRPKVRAAARAIEQINPHTRLDVRETRFCPEAAAELAGGVDLILDGTDNFRARFLINDVAVRDAIPWVSAGVIGAEAQILTIRPGLSPCLRCILPSEPPPCSDPTCRSVGVLGPAVAMVAGMQVAEAIKLLSGHADAASPWLRKFDLWSNRFQQIDLSAQGPDPDCPCCVGREWEFLEP